MLNNIGFAFGLLPIIAAFFNYKNLDITLRKAALFFLLTFLLDFLMWLTYLRYFTMKNNHPLLNMSILLSIIFYTYLYYNSFYSIQIRRFTLYSGIIVTSSIIISILTKGIYEYPDWANTTLGIYLMIVSLLFFFQTFNRQEFIQIEKQALFWINSGVLIYFSFTIFLYMLAGEISLRENIDINAISNIISNSFFAIGLSCQPQKTISNSY